MQQLEEYRFVNPPIQFWLYVPDKKSRGLFHLELSVISFTSFAKI